MKERVDDLRGLWRIQQKKRCDNLAAATRAIAKGFSDGPPGDAMAHALESTIREAYAAFGRGDVDGYLRPCSEDFGFNIPGRGAIAGSWRGKEGLYALARRAMEVTGGSFREEVEDVLANDHHAVVLARHRFTRDGQSKDYKTAHIYDVRNGKLAACWEQPQDLSIFDEAWGIVHASAAKL